MADVNTGYSPAQTYVNQQGLKLDNLVYVAGDNGKNTVASDTTLGVQHNDADVFVKTPDNQTGIYHPNMMKQFKAQYQPTQTGIVKDESGKVLGYVDSTTGKFSTTQPEANKYIDSAKQDYAFCDYVNKQFEQKSDEVFGLLKNQTPEQRAEFSRVYDQISADLDKKGLTPEQKKEELNLLSFKAIADLNKGTELGNKAMETYALGEYSKDTFSATNKAYAMPAPGEKNPYNQQGQDFYNAAGQVTDPAIKKKIEEQQMLQFFTLMSLLCGGGTGNFAAMFAPWMM